MTPTGQPSAPLIAAIGNGRRGQDYFHQRSCCARQQIAPLTAQGETRMTTYRKDSNIGRILQVSTIDTVASLLGRYGLVVVIGWIGVLKFANFEANQIQPLVANSPFMGWLYDIFSVYIFSALLGVFELAAAVLLAIKPLFPKLSIVGSVQAIVLFLATISFLFTTPGIGEPAGGGFPALSLIGEFLLKDIPLLGLSFWTLADAIRAVRVRSTVV
jgi:reactive chlorine resistance protein C